MRLFRALQLTVNMPSTLLVSYCIASLLWFSYPRRNSSACRPPSLLYHTPALQRFEARKFVAVRQGQHQDHGLWVRKGGGRPHFYGERIGIETMYIVYSPYPLRSVYISIFGHAVLMQIVVTHKPIWLCIVMNRLERLICYVALFFIVTKLLPAALWHPRVPRA